MRKKIIGIFGILAVVFLSVIFISNYRRINQMYPNPELLKSGSGEPEELDGYEFTLTDFQMTDGEEMKSILASVHIKRIAEGEGTINMTAVAGECGGWNNGIDPELYQVWNPGKSIHQLKFLQNQEEDIVIPISMHKAQFKKRDWERIDEKTFSIVLGLYPKKVILEGRCK